LKNTSASATIAVNKLKAGADAAGAEEFSEAGCPAVG